MASRRTTVLQKRSLDSLLAIRPYQQLRWNKTATAVTTEPHTLQQAQDRLARQRLRRPVSPHLQIYKWQVHSVSSAMERNTGLLFSGSLYLFGMSYLVSPMLGWDLSAASLVTAVAAWPVAVKLGVKFALAWPFTFHVINGMRYLAVSGAKTIDNKAMFVRIAWGVVATSFVSAVGLVAYF
ncbi:hypothetical protein ASPZODRAFT_13834 [Penicilliopsis zonata CBS 506.65]|uniref:Uncharacterized protein n=1 Tax=Penicilliopsis zonata CBS 506.65 TaxID=1073090 RepID=A0A1L9SPW5_9EURO|nr:hypothetical protein ASPZODRAFT_13834 [Penicilliopsis zonata CBS 506.65]OJJ49097.1 hypothetical protein ASPZODRAFT_13834 [Penicilliopsis zonata CBS 506.65]